MRDEFPCPHCGALLGKRTLERVRVTSFDPLLDQPTETLKRRPVSIEYTVGRTKHTKLVDSEDLLLVERIRQMPPAHGVPAIALPIAQMSHGSRLAPKGVNHVHQLFMPRPSHALTALWRKTKPSRRRADCGRFCCSRSNRRFGACRCLTGTGRRITPRSTTT